MAEESPSLISQVVKGAKVATEQALGGVFHGISNVGTHLTWIKYGPINYFRRNDPDYAVLLDKWDKYYEENARKYAVLPDWPILREIGRIKAGWHQVMFMKHENYHVYHTLNFSTLDSGVEFGQRFRAFIPGNNPLTYAFHSWDENSNYHPGSCVTKAEAHLQDRHTDQVISLDGKDGHGWARTARFEWNKGQLLAHQGYSYSNINGIRPKLIKTEDYNWHGNGLFYPLEGSKLTRPDCPIFASEEQERKFAGRWFSYKESLFGKKMHGHASPDEQFLNHNDSIYRLTIPPTDH